MLCNDVLSVLKPQVDIWLTRLWRMIAARLAARRSGSGRETENDEDFVIDGRIQVILLKRNSNYFTTTTVVPFYTAQRVLSVECVATTC